MFGGPPPRAERGEVRYLILDVLSERPRHGYEVIQAIEERCHGAYRPSPGTVYPTLQMLEEMGQVQSKEVDGRRTYELTDAGRTELEAHRDEVEDAYRRFGADAEGPAAPEQFHQTAERLHRLFRALGSAFRHGTLNARRWADIQRVINTAAEKIEELLQDK